MVEDGLGEQYFFVINRQIFYPIPAIHGTLYVEI